MLEGAVSIVRYLGESSEESKASETEDYITPKFLIRTRVSIVVKYSKILINILIILFFLNITHLYEA